MIVSSQNCHVGGVVSRCQAYFGEHFFADCRRNFVHKRLLVRAQSTKTRSVFRFVGSTNSSSCLMVLPYIIIIYCILLRIVLYFTSIIVFVGTFVQKLRHMRTIAFGFCV